MRRCAKCKETKEPEEFNKRKASKDGLQPYCRECHAAYRRVWSKTPAGVQSSRDRWHRYYRSDHGRRRTMERVRRAKAARKGSEGWCSEADLVAIYDLNDGLCTYCGEPAEHTDHVMPVALGGSGYWDNLLPACAPCNWSKGAQHPLSWALSLHERLGLPTPRRLLAAIEEALDES